MFSFAKDKSKNVAIDHQTFIFHHRDKQFYDCYELGGKLRSFNDVYRCKHRETKTFRSVKILRRDIDMDEETFLEKLAILKRLDHPNVVHIYESYEDSTHYYVVTDSMAHDDLYAAVAREDAFGDAHVAQIVATLLETLTYCHKHDVVHGDIQPKHILVPKGLGFDKLLLVNFFDTSLTIGSRRFNNNTCDDNDQEVSQFAAPDATTTTRSGVYSCGVIGYHFLTGNFPFEDGTTKKIPKSAWKDVVDPQARECLKALMASSPSKRPSAADAYDEDWLSNAKSLEVTPDKALQGNAMKSLIKLSNQNKLQQAVSAYVATHLLSTIDKQKWDDIFKASDRNSDGVLSKMELMNGFQKAGLPIPRNELDDLFLRLDLDGNGHIEYSEFLATQEDLVCQGKKLKDAFDAFDTDGNGFIEKEDLKVLFNTPGQKVLSSATAKAMIKNADQDGDGKLSFNEFVDMMVG